MLQILHYRRRPPSDQRSRLVKWCWIVNAYAPLVLFIFAMLSITANGGFEDLSPHKSKVLSLMVSGLGVMLTIGFSILDRQSRPLAVVATIGYAALVIIFANWF